MVRSRHRLQKRGIAWGVNYIKCDDICNTNLYRSNQYSAQHEIEMLAKAIQKCNRPIVLSLSPGPALVNKAWHLSKYANMWRITDDFWDNWPLLKDMFHRCELWQNHVTQGCYPDCDMLPLGRIGKGFGKERMTNFTKEEQRTMITLWCIFGSPLMLGAELTTLDDWTLSILTNKNILEMRNPNYKPEQILLDDTKAIWIAKNTEKETTYVALFNLSDRKIIINIPLHELGILKEEIKLLNLWDNTKISLKNNLNTMLPAHNCIAYKIITE